MRVALRAVGFVSCLAAAAAAAPARAADDPLALARFLYNQQQYEAAVAAAEEARLVPTRADAADLVAARAYLERFRASAVSDDLTNARDRLRRIDPQRLPPRERNEYVVGLGEALFFDGAYGAAAEVYDSVLQGRDLIAGDARDRVLDWWATALDREARPRADIERQPIYQRIRTRMEDELASHPASAAAAYWIAAAARAQGDLQAAWNAAQAAWVRSPLTPDHGESLREDLDLLMQRAIVPERAKTTAQPPETLRAQWEQFKERWRIQN
jgi:hypothetical protein